MVKTEISFLRMEESRCMASALKFKRNFTAFEFLQHLELNKRVRGGEQLKEWAVHVNWNPYKELLITLQTFKYVYFCSKDGLDYFRSIANPFDQEQKLLKDLVKEGHETEKDRELMNIIQSNCHRLELDNKIMNT
uniref:Cullin domain-containing protein n=1 Tax=Globodera pallida TaxID=36090 RepID=A0A183BXQ6_GLOPA